MRLLVISDTHGAYPRALKAHELAGEVDLIVHLGDGAEDARLLAAVLEVPVHRVAGNCDFDASLPTELTLEFEGCRLLATHGNRQQVKSGLKKLIDRGRALAADVVLYGHTHLPSVLWSEAMLLVNPGAVKEGFSGTYAILTLDGGRASAEIFRIDED